jgi:hypothetical protein
MIHHLTECKTDKTVIHKIEWSNERSVRLSTDL